MGKNGKFLTKQAKIDKEQPDSFSFNIGVLATGAFSEISTVNEGVVLSGTRSDIQLVNRGVVICGSIYSHHLNASDESLKEEECQVIGNGITIVGLIRDKNNIDWKPGYIRFSGSKNLAQEFSGWIKLTKDFQVLDADGTPIIKDGKLVK